MILKKEVSPLGTTYERIELSEIEIRTLDECHRIIAKRYNELGLEYTKQDKVNCEFSLLCILREDGIDTLIERAQNTPLARAESNAHQRNPGSSSEYGAF